MGWRFRSLGRLEEERAATPAGEIIKRVLPLFKPYKKYIVVVVVATFLRMVLNLVFPLLTGYLIDAAYNGAFDKLMMYSLYFLGGAAAYWVIGYVRVYFMSLTGQSFVRDLRNRLFRVLLRTKIAVLRREETGRTVSKVMNDVDVIGDTFTSGLIDTIADIVTMSGAFVIMATIDLKLTAAILPLIPLIFAINYYLAIRARKTFRQARNAIAKVTAKVEQEVSGAAVVKTFIQRRKRDEREFKQVSKEYVEMNVQATKIVSSVNPIMSVIRAVGVAIILYFGGLLILSGEISVGVLIAFYGYLDMFFRPLQTLALFFNTIQSALAAAERVTDLLKAEQETGGKLVKPVTGHVKYEDVHFGYKEGIEIIKGVSLTAAPGEMIAIVGPTCSGKSTLARLLLRFYEPWSGKILLDDIPVEEYDLEYLRKVVAYVPQEPAVISGTVLDNIVAGSGKDRRTVEEVLEKLGVKGLFEALPNGLMTEVVGEGKNLSRGQKQVISLVRAIVSSPRVLVLDEATSNVDVLTELKIYEGLRELMRERGMTVIVIAHRLAAMTGADKIYVLSHGRVVEQGRHDDLLRRKGLYAKLWETQAAGFAHLIAKN